MQRTLSKEHLAGFAKQTVSSIRRFISSSQDFMTLAQQDLVSTSKTIDGMWRKKQVALDGATVELWATSFQEELLFQLEWCNDCENGNNNNSNSSNITSINCELTENNIGLSVSPFDALIGKKKSQRKFIGESSMLLCAEVLRILLRSNGDKISEVLIRFQLVGHITTYLLRVPMSKKTRDAFASVLIETATHNSALLEECLTVCRNLFMLDEKSKGGNVVVPQQVHLAWLLATIFRRVDVNKLSSDTARVRCGREGFLSELIHTCLMLTSGRPEGVSDEMRFTAFLSYFGLVIAMVRGCAMNKTLCRGKHREDITELWVNAASNVSKVEQTLSIPTNMPGKDAVFTVEGAHFWASELIEFLVEVATSDSFSLKRQLLHNDLMNSSGSNGVLSTSSFVPLSSSSPSSSPRSSPGVARSTICYEPLPTHWDTLLTGGSDYAWHLASLLFNCAFFEDGCCLITEVLLRIDTQNTMSDFIYRNVITTLMLLCVATPRNAEMLAESPIMEALVALITYPQQSVFSREIIICGKSCTPSHPLNAYTVQMTVSFMSLLASLYVAEDTIPKLLRGVEEMCVRQTAQTDADIIESLLHVFSCTGTLRGTLFFPGNGSVVCKVDRFLATRFYGYSFAAWIYPKCIWLDGSHLFSFTEGSIGSVVLMVVANGRSCSLMLRTQHSMDVTLSTIPDTSFPANAWSHVVFTHNLSGFTLFINGRRKDNNLSVPFPKVSSKKNRLQFAFGGCQNQPSFFGLIASIELFDSTFSEKDVYRMYQAGPRPSRELSMSCHPLLSVESQVVAGTKLLSVGVTGCLAGRNEGVSVHGVLACSPLNTQEAFVREEVMNWALCTLAEARNFPPNFPVVAKLCIQFVCTALKLTVTEEEFNRMLDVNLVTRLREEVLKWDNMPIEVPAVLIACTIPRGNGKVMRSHPTTQIILSLLLDVISKPDINLTAILCILRELSDNLLYPENVAIFRMLPGRFERILALSVQLPLECVENLITLVERLCKEPREMEQTLKFLLSTPSSKATDFVKAEMLRMLFDIALTNTAMCDLIGGAFGNCGVFFLILLVGGKNHSSESIRVFALRILSLIQNTNKKFRELLFKSHIYEVLAAVMTDPSSLVPVRLPTFNCLFQMAFDAFRPTTEGIEVLSNLQQSNSSRTKRRPMRRLSHNNFSLGGVGQTLGLQGYMPGLVSPELRITRREYSFDVSYEFSYPNDTRFLFDDLHRVSRSGACAYTVLQVPQAIQTVLSLLELLLRNVNGSFFLDPATSYESSSDVNTTTLEDRGVNNNNNNNNTDSISTASALSPTQEDIPETVSLRVLGYLEKIIDSPENGETLLPYPWLQWMWGAVGQVIDPTCSNGVELSPKISRKQAIGIQQRMRNIVRSLSILDLSRNSKAGIVRTIRQGEQPPLLTRIVLEEIVLHFTKNRCEISNRNEAVNIIKNLDHLFQNIKDVLSPLPLALGLEIVNSISAIAVNNNSWLRMRMKNSSHLFETRNYLSFVLLTSIKKFSKLESSTLGQLLGTNGQEPNTIRILLHRLITAAFNCDADEVEVLLSTIRQIISADQNHYQTVLLTVGSEYCSFADLICGGVDEKRVTPSIHIEHNVMNSVLSSIPPVEKGSTVEELPASEVIQWCREDEARWEIVKQRVFTSIKFIEAVRDGDECVDVKKNRLAKLKRIEERRQSAQHKITVEVERIRREVNYHLSLAAGNGGGGSPGHSNSVMKTSSDLT